MSITSIWWLVLVLIAGEFGGVAWVRRNRYPRFLFHAWAPTLYAVLILGDLLIGALLTSLFGGSAKEAGDQAGAMIGWASAASLAVGAIALLTLFFRWITHTDISDIPD